MQIHVQLRFKNMKKTLLAISLGFLLAVPFYNFAQAPNLGTAANFVLFTSTGAVTNTGKTILTGNVGTNSGSNTGFGNVNGVMHTSNGVTATAKADLLTAYNQLNTTTATSAHSPLLGNGDTLKAGVYAISAPTTLNLNLILDAEGNPNAVFIFKLGATLSTNAASGIVLINGAKSCMVFWKVEGLVSMATKTSMVGTVIANNAAINMSTGATLEGRALSTTGAISVNGITANTPIGCGSPILTGPVAPNMGSSICYALFSGNGSLTNSGISQVTGDVGTNVGLTIGFNPLFVNGMIHPIPDGSTAACAADLLNVYTYLNTLPYDIELLYPAQFGQSLVLTPHTYLMNAATTLTDTIILDALGKGNAVFLIKINGALTTTTFAKVKLINGAKAVNVFWLIKGAVNINNFSEIAGTIICNNGAIDLKTGTKLNGRAFTTNGALSTAALNATMTAGCNLMPLTWLYFRGRSLDNKVLLEWATTNNINNKSFIVEHSNDGKVFMAINEQAAASNGEAVLHFTDAYPEKVNYYRIKQVDNDGRFSYSVVIGVNLADNRNNSFSIYPNPVGTVVNLSISSIEKQTAQIIIADVSGKVIYTKAIRLEKGNEFIQINNLTLNRGTYLTSIVFNGSKMTGKLIKQ